MGFQSLASELYVELKTVQNQQSFILGKMDIQ